MKASGHTDWYPGTWPTNLASDPTAYVGSTYTFRRFRSEASVAVRVAAHATIDDGATLDVGPCGSVRIGRYAIIGAALIICDIEVTIEDYAMVAWNAVLMDTYRRRSGVGAGQVSAPIRICMGAWIGFEACILPGVTVGQGTIVGARAVVHCSLPPGVLAAGNPARIVREL